MKQLLSDWGDRNLSLFQWINGHRWHELDRVMSLTAYVADIWSFAFYAGMWALVIVTVKHRRGSAAQLEVQLLRFILGYLVAVLVTLVLKFGLDFSRPLSVLGEHAVHLVGHPDERHSLPSGHAAFAMLLAVSLWPLLRVIMRFGAVLFVIWIGIGRMWVGAHFPADVLAGYLVGALSAALAAAALPHELASKLAALRSFFRDSRS